MNRSCVTVLLLTCGLVVVTTLVVPSMAAEPVMLWQDVLQQQDGKEVRRLRSCAILRQTDGSFAFYDRYHPENGPLELPDSQGTMHTLLPWLPSEIASSKEIIASGILRNTQVIQSAEGEVTSVFVKGEKLKPEVAAQVGLPRYLDVWMQQAAPSDVGTPRMIWRGYNGSQIEYERLPSGRLLVPFGSFQPFAKPVPPTGRHKTVVQYSDDNGATWSESRSKLISPCYPKFNGLNEGACEPAIERLADGRIWMLMRSQAGFLYESYSSDEGATWQEARASRFNTSTGPPCITRIQDGRLIVCWNNCEIPPRADGDGVYGGRDALHIAISDDEGRTWSGFREIYLDHRRNDNPAKSGDRGTAYPLAAWNDQGQIVVISGQGKGGRNVILIDPDWIQESTAQSDFSNGLEDWSVYSHYGPAKGWWRAREVGCRLVADPHDKNAQCLHLRNQDHLPADGATWNFPNGWTGSLTTRILLQDGALGGSIALNDRMFDPSNDYGETFAVFRLDIDAEGRIGDVILRRQKWYDVTFDWDLSQQRCRVLVDGQPAATLPVLNPTLNGLSYVRYRAAASGDDPAGYLVGDVGVGIRERISPVWSDQQVKAHEERYVSRVVPTWQQ